MALPPRPVASETSSAGKQDAQNALFAAITHHVAAVEGSGLNTTQRATALKSLAFAYRLAAGGPQPGSVEIDK